jgi:hypothetical protein
MMTFGINANRFGLAFASLVLVTSIPRMSYAADMMMGRSPDIMSLAPTMEPADIGYFPDGTSVAVLRSTHTSLFGPSDDTVIVQTYVHGKIGIDIYSHSTKGVGLEVANGLSTGAGEAAVGAFFSGSSAGAPLVINAVAKASGKGGGGGSGKALAINKGGKGGGHDHGGGMGGEGHHHDGGKGDGGGKSAAKSSPAIDINIINSSSSTSSAIGGGGTVTVKQ